MRILGRGKTAQAILEQYPDSNLYDDLNIEEFNKDSEELTVVSPGIPPYNQLVKNTKNLISEYDLFANTMPYSIWISGTNGKTTTTSMLQHLLEEQNSQCGGNIGTPLGHMDQTKNIWVLETSSFTLHYTNIAKPNLYILLPISDDHASWHGDFIEYEKSKLKALDNLKEGEIAIIPKKYENYPTNGYKVCYESSSDLAKNFDIDMNKINFDEPYLIDALLALSVSRILFDKVDYNKINSFVQDPHKLEKIYDKYNRLWINDSKATNIDATIQALKSYKNKKVYLILGGDDKGANLEPLFKELTKYNVNIYAIGSNTNKLFELSNRYNILCQKCNELEVAVNIISTSIDTNGLSLVLLSPAAASLDQFTSYASRGDLYKNLINNII
ncbi:MAG: UDP-N-acetylmuramoyl-L-alanine--D-glutamate ligase [Campylobacteraceae bacterium]|jgi:UDP-N-acetylmuramoylalanine--D-glutamate ligase|nr:UDP-N-acetylmuramoyl-L-alanine--D-glutamate ligase [Campylobacteraceae bacterium]MBT7118238.1 UDP-N-acetylmuramoyl-L-alanine--D-glutamate ligase [Campylobacteraceae bacterium]